MTQNAASLLKAILDFQVDNGQTNRAKFLNYLANQGLLSVSDIPQFNTVTTSMDPGATQNDALHLYIEQLINAGRIKILLPILASMYRTYDTHATNYTALKKYHDLYLGWYKQLYNLPKADLTAGTDLE